MLDTRAVTPGEHIRNTRTGNLYRVDRIVPAGSAGTRHSDGPTVMAQPVREDGTLGDFRASLWDGSTAYPLAEWEKVTACPIDGCTLGLTMAGGLRLVSGCPVHGSPRPTKPNPMAPATEA